MRFSGIFLALALGLAACGSPPSETAITPELFEDSAAMQKIGNRLAPADRDAWGKYTMSRMASNAGIGPSLVTADGKDPATVGEAIALVKEMDVAMANVEALQAEMEAKREPLIAEREKLMVAAEAARWAPAETQAANAKGEEINQLQEDYGRRMDELRQSIRTSAN